MLETVPLQEKNGVANVNRGVRRLRGLCILTILLLPSVYLLTDSPGANQIHHTFVTTIAVPFQEEEHAIPAGYLIWSPNCQIPDRDPLEKSSMKIFKKRKYVACSAHRLTYVLNDDKGNNVLYINSSAVDKPLSKGEYVSCCYSNITRSSKPADADSKIIKSKCTDFNSSTTLKSTEEFIVTNCIIKNRKFSKKIYQDAHSNIQITNKIKERLENLKPNLNNIPWSILIIGIDTLSRINLARAMPHTQKFLVKNSWLDFQGYNKIDDNTYPNLMAFLTGRNQSRARLICEGGNKTSLDNCDFMWKKYQKYGYVTAYGEDYVGIDTFGKPLHKGFSEPPTDHYMRPLFMAAEKLKDVNSNKLHCTGQITSGEVLMNYALSFVKKYKDHPFFGFFWANTFSHDDVSSPSRMDYKTTEFLEQLKSSGAMNTTLVFFVSDHGIRFGDLRATLTGYFEERLPSFYLWLPPLFKEQFPTLHDNIVTNTKRLVSPYDFYLTLNDILKLSVKENVSTNPSEACATCQSLLQPVSWNRTCEEAGISSHWCTCHPLETLSVKHEIGNRAIIFILEDEVEKILSSVNKNDCRICAKLTLQKVISISIYKYSISYNFNDYLIVFSTNPGNMVFESTVRHYVGSDTFETQGIVSRLTTYRGKGGCVKTAYLKKYCFCTGKCKSKS